MNADHGITRGHKGRGRIYFGLGISLVALFWLAKKVGWLGAGSSGIIWPLLVIALGLAIALAGTGRRGHAGHLHNGGRG